MRKDIIKYIIMALIIIALGIIGSCTGGKWYILIPLALAFAGLLLAYPFIFKKETKQNKEDEGVKNDRNNF